MDSPRCRKPCSRCPWRKDAPLAFWDLEHFRTIWHTCQDDGDHMMLCHKSQEKPDRAAGERPLPCQGWVRVVGTHAIGVRLGLLTRDIRMEEVKDRERVGVTLYASFEEMVRAQGIKPPPRNVVQFRKRRQG